MGSGWTSGTGAPSFWASRLAEREVVGQGLAGVKEVGEAVDHRHRAVARQVQDVLVSEDPGHDPVHEPREHACGVGDALAPLKLYVVDPEVEGGPPELEHPGLEGYPRPRRGLLEDHGQRL